MAPQQAKISEAVLGPAASWLWALDAMQSALPSEIRSALQ